MLSYNTRNDFANAEQRTGYDALMAGLTMKAAGLVFVQNGNGYRKATHGEQQGILMAETDQAVAEYTGKISGVKFADLLADSDIDLDGFDWDGYADSECTCTPLSVMACPACLNRSAARWDPMDIPF